MFESHASVSVNDNITADFRPVAVNNWNAQKSRSVAEQLLPFSVKVVQSADELADAVSIRHTAYARHIPEFAKKLAYPEAADFEAGSVVLLAKSKLDDTPLGTARLQTNEFRPLPLEASVELPTQFGGRRLAEGGRLGVQNGGIGRAVKIALVKALFEYCEINDIEHALLVARSPIDRQYSQLLFEDVFPEVGFIPMGHVGNLPHRVMNFEIASGEARWRAANHPLLTYFRETYHPDISIDQRLNGQQLEQLWLKERELELKFA